MRSRVARARSVALALGVATIAIAKPAVALTINPEFDSTITGLANRATVEQTFRTAAAAYAVAFSDPVSVNVQVSWGRVGSYELPGNAVGASVDQLYGYYSYNQVQSLLWADATTPADISAVWHLPTSAPNGADRYVIPSASAKALGVIGASNAALDGSIGFAGDSVTGYTYTGSAVAPDTYDFVAVAEHEIAEVLGRISGLGSATPSWRTPLDLFRYSAPGELGFAYDSAAYLSADGGLTDLADYNYSSVGGDRGDWLTTAMTRDSQDAFISTGEHAALTAADLVALDLIGWHGASGTYGAAQTAGSTRVPAVLLSVPEPSSLTLVAMPMLMVGFATYRRF